MNLLTTGIKALAWPFEQNREQRLRAEGLARLGAVRVLDREDLDPRQLAAIIQTALQGKNWPVVDVDLEGGRHTAEWVENRLRPSGSPR